ncbi:MAG: hypothetical protein Q9224_007470 [Gallowayella concinna]
MVINGANELWHAKKQGTLHEALEDGTPAFHSIAALHCALDVHQRLYGSMSNVSQHCSHLAANLHSRLASLAHGNGRSVCTIYKGKTADYSDPKTQGPTIAFNLQTSSGTWIGKSDFERLATINDIQLRTGGVCNPGGIASYLDLSPREMRENFAEGLRCGNGFDEMNGKPTGIIRVSFGAMSSTRDVDAFMRFMNIFVDENSRQTTPSKHRTLLSESKHFGTSTSTHEMLSGSEEPCDIAGCHDTIKIAALAELSGGSQQATTHLVQVAIVTSPCPVAGCSVALASSQELWAHFKVHRSCRRGRWSLRRICNREGFGKV